MDNRQIRSQFPITRQWVFLNHAGVAPISLRSRDYMQKAIQDTVENAGICGPHMIKAQEETRSLAARLIGAEPEEIAFVKNTSEGISFIANGLTWREGDNVVSANVEFPANIYPWMNLASSGVRLRLVEEEAGRIPVEKIAAAIDERTRVVALSWVEFSSGFRNHLEEVGRICRRRNIFFFVDAIQGLGALKLNVKKCNIDALSADGHKWLLALEGCGIFYLSKSRASEVAVREVGWGSVKGRDDYLNYDLTLRDDARRFEPGTLNNVGIYGLKGALELFLELGPDFIEERILTLTERLSEGALAKGYKIYSSRILKERSGIVSLYKEGIDSKEMAKDLRQKRIVISVREGRLRVSPHFYNNEEEIDTLISALP